MCLVKTEPFESTEPVIGYVVLIRWDDAYYSLYARTTHIIGEREEAIPIKTADSGLEPTTYQPGFHAFFKLEDARKFSLSLLQPRCCIFKAKFEQPYLKGHYVGPHKDYDCFVSRYRTLLEEVIFPMPEIKFPSWETANCLKHTTNSGE